MDRTVLVLSALLLNAFLAGPRQLYAPLHLSRISRIPAAYLRDAERRLNRSHRSLEQRELRGTILVIVVTLISLLVGWLCDGLFKNNLRFIEIIMLAVLLPARQTWDLVAHICRELKAGNLAKAKMGLEGSAWRHYMLLDEYGVARAGIEMLAVHFSEKIMAPIFWYLLFGLPGLFISRAIYLMVETLTPLANSEPSEAGFKSATMMMYFILNYVPSRIAAILWPVAVLLPPSGDPLSVIKVIASGKFITGSPQTVSVLAAAGALSVSLGGPTSVYAAKDWLGTGTVKATPANLKRALYLFALLHLLLFVTLGLFL